MKAKKKIFNVRKQGSINTAEEIKYGTALYDAKMIRILASADREYLSSVDEIYESLYVFLIYLFFNFSHLYYSFKPYLRGQFDL
jgi:hypothetical protein